MWNSSLASRSEVDFSRPSLMMMTRLHSATSPLRRGPWYLPNPQAARKWKPTLDLPVGFWLSLVAVTLEMTEPPPCGDLY